jgi:hypothetical protein
MKDLPEKPNAKEKEFVSLISQYIMAKDLNKSFALTERTEGLVKAKQALVQFLQKYPSYKAKVPPDLQ